MGVAAGHDLLSSGHAGSSVGDNIPGVAAYLDPPGSGDPGGRISEHACPGDLHYSVKDYGWSAEASQWQRPRRIRRRR